MVYQWLKNIQNFVLPPSCLLCGARGLAPLDLCAACCAELPRNLHACAGCAEPLPPSAPPGSLCGRCQRKPPVFARAFAPYLYAWPLDGLIQQLKFGHQLAAARSLGSLLAERLQQRGGPWPELLLPVPLHPRRLAERGYNQATELARPLARHLGLPLRELAARARATARQSDLPYRERRRNVAGAFILRESITARHVAIVDDVLTTGHTASALTNALHLAGVETVEVWALARTAPPGWMSAD